MVYMYHSFLIHSSADGHLGCFHVLAIVASYDLGFFLRATLKYLKEKRKMIWIKQKGRGKQNTQLPTANV